MSASLHHFAPAAGYVDLVSPGSLPTGETFYALVYHHTIEEGGGIDVVWSGTDYGEALNAAGGWTEEGTRFVDSVGRAWIAEYGEFLPRVDGGAA